MIEIPLTREAAIDAIAELDAARWGEAEREHSRQINSRKSYGLLLNTLAHRPEYDFGDAVPHLVAAAKQALTSDDIDALRNGG